MDILIPVSAGHLIDQITILGIKKKHITDEKRRQNVCRELTALMGIRAGIAELNTPAVLTLEQSLVQANEQLWAIEDELRSLEHRKEFGERFVAAARKVYQTNDRRAALKAEIDHVVGSPFRDEKWFSVPV